MKMGWRLSRLEDDASAGFRQVGAARQLPEIPVKRKGDYTMKKLFAVLLAAIMLLAMVA